jgi:hypothetical protein
MTLMGLLILLIIFCIIVYVARFLPAPFNPAVIWITAAIVIIILLYALLGGGGLGLNTPLHVR